MPRKPLNPDDPRALAAVLERIKTLSREEWIEHLQAYPDFDPAWIGPQSESRTATVATVETPTGRGA